MDAKDTYLILPQPGQSSRKIVRGDASQVFAGVKEVVNLAWNADSLARRHAKDVLVGILF